MFQKNYLDAALRFIKSTSIIIFAFFSWWILTFAFISVLNWINTEHYQPDDFPNNRFDVLIVNEQGQQLLKKWSRVKENSQIWVREADSTCHAEDCLVKQDDGSLIFHNDGALWSSQSHYRIEGNELIPISFLFFTIGTVFNAMILASLIYAIGKYGVKRWLYRNSVEQTKAYNQQVRKKLKTLLVWFGAFIGFYLVISLLNK